MCKIVASEIIAQKEKVQTIQDMSYNHFGCNLVLSLIDGLGTSHELNQIQMNNQWKMFMSKL